MADERSGSQPLTRRGFLGGIGRGLFGVGVAGIALTAATRSHGKRHVWQIDPFKCVQCGRCRTECVLEDSAVKCVHDYAMCGYCDLCTGFFHPEPNQLETGAENQLCPAGAIVRRFIEEPYFEYDIDETLCTGCGICVKGCTDYGNGSLYLQVRQDRCLNCNQCAIAVACPSDAFMRVPADRPYVVKHLGRPKENG
jgi:electron transport complex protein RnfB